MYIENLEEGPITRSVCGLCIDTPRPQLQQHIETLGHSSCCIVSLKSSSFFRAVAPGRKKKDYSPPYTCAHIYNHKCAEKHTVLHFTELCCCCSPVKTAVCMCYFLKFNLYVTTYFDRTEGWERWQGLFF